MYATTIASNAARHPHPLGARRTLSEKVQRIAASERAALGEYKTPVIMSAREYATMRAGEFA